MPWPRFLLPPVWVQKPWTYEPLALGWAANAPLADDVPISKLYDPWKMLFDFIFRSSGTSVRSTGGAADAPAGMTMHGACIPGCFEEVLEG